MKNLKLYNLHTNYLNNKAYIQLGNDIYPYASSCLDDMDLHIDKGYEIINYIENNSTAYINTNIPYNNITSNFEIKFKFNEMNRGTESIIGNESTFGNYSHSLYKYAYNHSSYPNRLYYYSGYSSSTTSRSANQMLNPIDLEPHTYKYIFTSSSVGTFYIDGILKYSYSVDAQYVNSYVPRPTTFLFNRYANTTENFYGRIYYYKVWDNTNNTIIHYLLPIRTANTIGTKRYGFVDACTGKTYFSSTSVELTGG